MLMLLLCYDKFAFNDDTPGFSVDGGRPVFLWSEEAGEKEQRAQRAGKRMYTWPREVIIAGNEQEHSQPLVL